MKKVILKQIGLLFMVLTLSYCSSDDGTSNQNSNNNNPPEGSGLTLINQATIGGPGFEFGIDMVATTAGYIICGVNNLERPYLIGVDSDFQVVWEQNLGTVDVGGFESVINTADGNYAAAGFTQNGAEDLDLDFYVVKFGASGNVIWEKSLGISYVTDTTMDLVETSSGDLIVAGTKITEPLSANFNNNTTDMVLARLDASGNVIWTQTYGGPGNESLSSVLEDSSGAIYIGGTEIAVVFNGGQFPEFLPGDIKIIKIDGSGDIINESTLGSPESDGSARLQLLSSGEVAVLASTSGTGGDITGNHFGEGDVWLFTLNSNLQINRQITIGGIGNDFARQMIADNNEEYFLVGRSNSNTFSMTNQFSPEDFWILKLASDFSVLDHIYLGGSDFDSASAAVINEGRLVVVGSTVSNDGDVEVNNGSWDIWVTVIEDLE
jgi:hypothetical protein